MIDYIKIMKLIIAFIRATNIPVDLDNLLTDANIKILINVPFAHQILISKDTRDWCLIFSISILCVIGLISLAYMGHIAEDIDTNKLTSIEKNIFIFSFIICILSAIGLIYSFIFFKNTNTQFDKVENDIKTNYYTNTVPSFELETANALPNSTMTKEDILSFEHFAYDKPDNPTIYEKGNLYELPIPTLLKEANVQSIKNLYDNINFLNNYYDNNYINDEKYHWINTQLNAFYNSNPVDNTNTDILKNLKN